MPSCCRGSSASIPPGSWMSYGDVARAAGGGDTHARTLNGRFFHPHGDARLAPGAEGGRVRRRHRARRPGRGRRMLEAEGLEFEDGRAPQTARVRPEPAERTASRGFGPRACSAPAGAGRARCSRAAGASPRRARAVRSASRSARAVADGGAGRRAAIQAEPWSVSGGWSEVECGDAGRHGAARDTELAARRPTEAALRVSVPALDAETTVRAAWVDWRFTGAGAEHEPGLPRAQLRAGRGCSRRVRRGRRRVRPRGATCPAGARKLEATVWCSPVNGPGVVQLGGRAARPGRLTFELEESGEPAASRGRRARWRGRARGRRAGRGGRLRRRLGRAPRGGLARRHARRDAAARRGLPRGPAAAVPADAARDGRRGHAAVSWTASAGCGSWSRTPPGTRARWTRGRSRSPTSRAGRRPRRPRGPARRSGAHGGVPARSPRRRRRAVPAEPARGARPRGQRPQRRRAACGSRRGWSRAGTLRRAAAAPNRDGGLRRTGPDPRPADRPPGPADRARHAGGRPPRGRTAVEGRSPGCGPARTAASRRSPGSGRPGAASSSTTPTETRSAGGAARGCGSGCGAVTGRPDGSSRADRRRRLGSGGRRSTRERRTEDVTRPDPELDVAGGTALHSPA